MKFVKFILVLIVFGLIINIGFSQNEYTKIKISEDIELIKLSEDIYVHISYADMPGYGRIPSNGMIYLNKNEAFLFDTPITDSLTKDLYNWLSDSLKLKIVGFIPNHWHSDCMGGLRYLQKHGVDSYANEITIEIAKSKELPVPAHGFKDSLRLQLGNKQICCYYLGAAHTLDNIVVWIPSEKVLFAGCMVKSLNSSNLGNTVDGDLKSYPKTIDNLIKKFSTAKIVIPGHGQFGDVDLIKHTRELLIQK
jgi:metallo-beta-lactamase class B